MRFPLGPWEPDSAGVDIKDGEGRVVMADAKNVFPLKTGYGPIPALSDLSTYALPAKCVGAFYARTNSGSYQIFAGTATKLYKYDPSTGWVDYTRTVGGNYNVQTDDYWQFCQFGTEVIAVNINDAPQVIDIATGATAFSALGGSPPNSRYVAVVGDFVVLACQATNDRKITNSAINSATGWTVGTNLCDEQEFADGGSISGLAGVDENGWVVQQKSIRKMIFQPGFDQAFRFERVEREKGARASYSSIAVGNSLFYLTDDGFYSYSNQLVTIGAQRVNAWFRANCDINRMYATIGCIDPFAPRVFWAFYNGTSATTFNRIIIYDWQLDRWSYGAIDAMYWAQIVTAGVTLESLDSYGTLDSGAIPYPFDSPVWAGGQLLVGAITSLGRLAFLNGTLPQDARLLTCPQHLVPEARCNVASVYPLGVYNDATIAIRVGKREHTKNAVVYTSSLTPSTRSGIARCRATGRVHEIELSLTQASGTSWTLAEGLELDVKPDGLQ